MSAAPSKEELRAFGLGKLDPARAAEVAAYVGRHPECLAVVASAPDDEVVGHLRGAKEVPSPRKRSLLELAIDAVLPVVAGCAGAMAGGVEGGLIGVVVGQAAEKAVNWFGGRIVERWKGWLHGQPPAVQAAALAELAEVPPEAARSQVAAALAARAPQASEEDRRAAAEYLGAIPLSVRRSLLSDRGGGRTLLPSVSVDDPASLLQLLPASLPPYAAPCVLPGTTYQLEELIGTGGFGAVYRAISPDMQYLPLAIKFCLDRSLVEVLRREKDNLERLIREAGQSWSPRIVRLYGYNLEQVTPYLVYEYVAGGDLASWLARRRARTGKGLTPPEVLGLIVQVVEALAFAHERGIVHRDLKPANVLIEDERFGKLKLADFGIGGVAVRVAQTSRVGTVASSMLSAAERVSLFRGAGTPLYMDRHQKEGKAPDPRHDLRSLGVMWYQLLVGDVRRELDVDWEDELTENYDVPRNHIEILKQCVGLMSKRPRDAGELLGLMRGRATPPKEALEPVDGPTSETSKAVSPAKAKEQREQVARALVEVETAGRPSAWVVIPASLSGGLAAAGLVLFAAVLVGEHSPADTRPFSLLALSSGGVLVAVALLVAVMRMVIRGRRRAACAAAASALVSAQTALSLSAARDDPRSLCEAGDHKKLCEVGWTLVREIEKYHVKPDARVRIHCGGGSGVVDVQLKVYVNGRYLGDGGLRSGYDLTALLCRGTHWVEARGWGVRYQAVVVVPEDSDYGIEVTWGSVKVEWKR